MQRTTSLNQPSTSSILRVQKRDAVILGVLLTVALGFRLFSALRHPNLYYPDELYQTQEPAHRMAFGYGVVPWEWRDGIRSYVFPFLLSIVMRVSAPLVPGSAGYLAATTVLMCVLSLAVVWFCYRWAERVAGQAAGLIAGGTAAVWFLMIFFAPKTLTEVVATDCLLPGLLVGARARETGSRQGLLWAGVLLGTAVSLRPQFAPTALVLGFWLCWTDLRRFLPVMALGAFLPIALFGIVDAFTLGYPLASFVRYIWVNVGQGKSKQFGTEPWYFFVKKLVIYCWPLLIPAILGLRKSPVLGWLLLVLVGSHSVLAHKEFRFVYAAVPVIVTLFGIGCVEIADWLRKRSVPLSRAVPVAAMALALCASAFLGHRWSHWSDSGGQLLLGDAVSRDPGVCGVGYWGQHWAWTGGYTHIHRKIPILMPVTKGELQQDAGQFNLLISRGAMVTPPAGFSLDHCTLEVCAYRRTGMCAPPGPDEINNHLRQIGQ